MKRVKGVRDRADVEQELMVVSRQLIGIPLQRATKLFVIALAHAKIAVEQNLQPDVGARRQSAIYGREVLDRMRGQDGQSARAACGHAVNRSCSAKISKIR